MSLESNTSIDFDSPSTKLIRKRRKTDEVTSLDIEPDDSEITINRHSSNQQRSGRISPMRLPPTSPIESEESSSPFRSSTRHTTPRSSGSRHTSLTRPIIVPSPIAAASSEVFEISRLGSLSYDDDDSAPVRASLAALLNDSRDNLTDHVVPDTWKATNEERRADESFGQDISRETTTDEDTNHTETPSVSLISALPPPLIMEAFTDSSVPSSSFASPLSAKFATHEEQMLNRRVLPMDSALTPTLSDPHALGHYNDNGVAGPSVTWVPPILDGKGGAHTFSSGSRTLDTPSSIPAAGFPEGSSSQATQTQPRSSSTSLESRFGLGDMWQYFKGELVSEDFDEAYDVKKERVQNFLAVPLELEKLMTLGYLICFDSFLYTFTILPARLAIASVGFVRSLFSKTYRLMAAQKCDIMKGGLLFICCVMLENVDSSRLYHSVRGQATIKLYVIFNVLEICDKLCSAFGHDILDSLFSKATVEYRRNYSASARRIGRMTHFVVALCYVFAHAMVLFYQVMTLNVAINSYNNALLTLLMSNQFVEIKGSVFKKFERENLFQLSCSDIVERFQLSIFLMIIIVRNFVELIGPDVINAWIASSRDLFTSAITPQGLYSISKSVLSTIATVKLQSLAHFPWDFVDFLSGIVNSSSVNFVMTLIGPAAVVFGTEIMVDWLKHAFITKFNQIRPSIYRKFSDSLQRDLVGNTKKKVPVAKPGIAGVDDSSFHYPAESSDEKFRMTDLDRSPSVARRIGFVSLPLACLVLRIISQTIRMLRSDQDSGPPAPWDLNRQGGNMTSLANIVSDDIPEWVKVLGGDTVWAILVDYAMWWIQPEVRAWVYGGFVSYTKWFISVAFCYFIALLCKIALGLTLSRKARSRLQIEAGERLTDASRVPSTVAPISSMGMKSQPSPSLTISPPSLLSLNTAGAGSSVAASGAGVGSSSKDGNTQQQQQQPGSPYPGFDNFKDAGKDLALFDGQFGFHKGVVRPPSPAVVDPASPDENLDRVDRFLMVRSRIV
ncbi:hypothetical protein HDU76_013018 [Blyttiomyces sp. JEL0837]|nr:hypothetical protein HDU76_013018 [Blyttiomyces sp. JEL0837]